MPSDDAELTAYVRDRTEIRRLVHDYNHALDNADEELFASIWTADAGWHFPEESSGIGLGRLDGIDAILAAFRAATAGPRRMNHLTTNLVVTIDGDSARGASKSFTSGRVMPSLAEYDDRFVRDGGTWKFARRSITPHLHGNTLG